MRSSTPAIRAALLLLTVQAVTGCNEPLGTTDSGRLPLVISAAVVGDGANAAYLKTDAVRVRVTDSSQAVVEETTLSYNPSESGNAVSVEVDGDLVGQRLTVQVELLASSAATFRGQGSATPTIGTPASVEIFLTPIISAVDAPASVGPITAIGGTLQLEADAVFATGDIVPGAAVSWAPLDPDIVSVSPTGVARALAEGVGRVEASAGAASAVIRVNVQATVVSVDVQPAEASINVEETIEFTAIPRDGNRNALSGRNATWASSNPDVLEIVGPALAIGVSPGTAEVIATIDGIEGSAAVTVNELVPDSPANLTASASGTTVMLEWDDNSVNETRYEVRRAIAPQPMPSVRGISEYGDLIAMLGPNATQYTDATGLIDELLNYTILACNDAGCSASNGASVATMPQVPTNLDVLTIQDPTIIVAAVYYDVLVWSDNSQYEDYYLIEELDFDVNDYVMLGSTTGEKACLSWFPVPLPGPCFTLGQTFVGGYFAVRACNDAGCSDPALHVRLGEPPPLGTPPPTGGASSAGGDAPIPDNSAPTRR